MQLNPQGENVIVLRPTYFGTYEFIRLPVDVAYKLADLLELAAENAATTPVVTGPVGEVNGASVRSLGTAQMLLKLSVKRPGTVRLRVHQTLQGIHRRTHRSTPTLSVDEARRFAALLREANRVPGDDNSEGSSS